MAECLPYYVDLFHQMKAARRRSSRITAVTAGPPAG